MKGLYIQYLAKIPQQHVTERKHQTSQLIIGKAGTTSAMLVMRAVEN